MLPQPRYYSFFDANYQEVRFRDRTSTDAALSISERSLKAVGKYDQTDVYLRVITAAAPVTVVPAHEERTHVLQPPAKLSALAVSTAAALLYPPPAFVTTPDMLVTAPMVIYIVNPPMFLF